MMVNKFYPINDPPWHLLEIHAEHDTDVSHHYVSLTAYFPNPDTAAIPPHGTITRFPLMKTQAWAEGVMDLTHYRADLKPLQIRVYGYRYLIDNPRTGPPNTNDGIELFGSDLPNTHPNWDATAWKNIGYSKVQSGSHVELIIKIYCFKRSSRRANRIY